MFIYLVFTDFILGDCAKNYFGGCYFQNVQDFFQNFPTFSEFNNSTGGAL